MLKSFIFFTIAVIAIAVSTAQDTPASLVSNNKEGGLRGLTSDRSLQVVGCPSDPVLAQCRTPGQECASNYISIPVRRNKKPDRCARKKDMICTPTLTCVCSEGGWECEDLGEVEQCRGRKPEGAYEPCSP